MLKFTALVMKMKVIVAQSSPTLFVTPLTVRLLCLFNSPGKTDRVGSHSLLQGIFLTQGLNPGLLHCRQILYHLSHRASPIPLAMGLNKHILVLAARPHISLLLLLQLLLLLLLLTSTGTVLDLAQLSLHTLPLPTLFCVLGGWPE